MGGMARYAPGQQCFRVRMTTRGRITLPKPARDALGWHPGDEIVFRVEGNRVILTKKGVRPAMPGDRLGYRSKG